MPVDPSFLAPRPPEPTLVEHRKDWTQADRRPASLDLRHVELERCDLAGVIAPGATWQRCVLRGCRLTGLILVQATLEDVRFVDCRMDVMSLRETRARRVSFENCVLAEAELDDAKLDFTRFERCDLSRSSWAGTSCARVELRGCTLTGLRSIAGLRGAGLPWDDLVGLVPALAAHLGIEVL